MSTSPFIIGISLVGIGFLTGLSGALIPGPLFAFVISDTLKKGALSGPLAIIGHISVELPLIVVLVVLGLELMKSYFSLFESLIYAIGGFALILISLFIIKEGKAAAELRSSENEIRDEMRVAKYNSSIFAGFLLTAFNPSFIPWWMGIGFPVLFNGFKQLALMGIILVTLGHFLSDFAWYSFVSFSFAKGKNFFVGKRYELTMLAIAIFLIALGVLFFIKGATGYF
ncbi:MAG: LysE family translocator [Methanophagales archaeon]|nr:LysE family translocator [Methanophagales archaeon]MCW3140762.1 LysE family translocator [Methanophagales archaeon]